MIKEELLKVLEEGLKLNRIDQKQYDEAMRLFTLIYENHAASESSKAHAALASLINQATNYDPSQMSRDSSVEVVEAELRAAQEFLTANPVLKSSPADLEKMNMAVDTYLSPYDEATRELYKEYYDV